MAERERKKTLGRQQAVEVPTVLALHSSVLYPSPLGSRAHQNNHIERVDIGTPGGCGLGDKKIPEYS